MFCGWFVGSSMLINVNIPQILNVRNISKEKFDEKGALLRTLFTILEIRF